jgi:nitrite reductase/ring-hydroxylating ferredoxin subunit
VLPQAQQPQVAPPALRAHGLPAGAVASQQAKGSLHKEGVLSAKACAAVCGLAAAAGLASSSRKRTSLRAEPVAVAVVPEHMQPVVSVYDGVDSFSQVYGDWTVPVPGSDKMLQTMVGADVETGSKPWDPMGFSKLYDRNFDFNGQMIYPHVQWLREAEIKHGRCAMLAFVGMLVQGAVQIPGYPAEPDWTKALAACYAEKLPTIGIIQISVFAMLVEGKFFPMNAWIGQMDREPGDLGFDPLKFTKKADFDFKAVQLKEIKNGRLAMIGVLSMAAASGIPGSVPFISAMSALPSDCSSVSSRAFCGETMAAARPAAEAGASKTAARYTTQLILPALAWLRTGFKASSLSPGGLKAFSLAGNDVLLGKTEAGKLFCVGNLCPHIGTPMSEGADVIGDVIVCPLHGSSFKTTTGELIDWCPSPPIIGPLTGLVVDKKNLLIFECRESGLFGGGDIEVLVDTNAKKAYEADYWKGLLDAQGKDDGTYY